MQDKRNLLAALLLLPVCAGCAPATAEGGASRFEHGVYEVIQFQTADGETHRYTWVTATRTIDERDIAGLWSQLGIKADSVSPESDALRVLDHLDKQGWQLVNRSDGTLATNRGTAMAHWYTLRRKLG